MKLEKLIKVTGTIKLESGLHIGGGKDDLEIGGVDDTVVKHPLTSEPYIPGSSIKGKMRSGMERKLDRYNKEKGEPCGCGERECDICILFGAHKNPRSAVAPSRVLFRDAFMSSQTRDKFAEFQAEKGKSYMEIKAENTLNRNTMGASPRFFERVPAGATFDMEIIIQVFDKDDPEHLKKRIEEGLNLIENTYLGGSGSRGYGKVSIDFSFEDIEI